MIIPEDLVGKICRTKISGLISSFEKIDEVKNLWPNSEIDVVYENGISVLVIIFENTEDCLAFKLKYGESYA